MGNYGAVVRPAPSIRRHFLVDTTGNRRLAGGGLQVTSTFANPVLAAATNALEVYQIDPLQDVRWERFIQAHPRASVFHTTSWLTALRNTYGYEPQALCTATSGQCLTSGVVFCRVKSWLTGNRIVSLPFSDHCDPLLRTGEERNAILSRLKCLIDGRREYVELRPADGIPGMHPEFAPCHTYARHTIDLSGNCDALFRSFHKDCVQRRIRRAEREGLGYEVGNSDALLSTFYPLFVKTRRRHHLPPQPYSWFQNLAAAFGDRLQIRVAAHQGRPVASILTLKYGRTVVYKYGCSDTQFNHLGGTALLLWRTIEEAKQEGLTAFDLGRSDPDNLGLIRFKSRWGATAEVINYLRFPGPSQTKAPRDLTAGATGALIRLAPKWSLIAVGKFLYRHVG